MPDKSIEMAESSSGSEAARAVFADMADEIVIVHELDGTIKYANQKAKSVLGREIVGTSIFDLVSGEQEDLLKERMERRLAGDYRPFLYEAEIEDERGRRLHFEVSSTVIGRMEEGCEILLVARDIATRKQLEETRNRLERKLSALERMNDVGRMAGEVAHYLNGTLTAILGYAEGLEPMLGGEPDGSRLVSNIRGACTKAKEIIGSLLAFAQKGGAARKPVDMNRLVADVVAEVSENVPMGIDLRVEGTANLPMVEVDPEQIATCLKHMLENSIEALEGRSGRIKVSTSMVRLDEAEGDLSPGSYVKLSVEDDGIGMDPDVLSHAFDPFFTTKLGQRRIGLGLAMVYGTALSYNGSAVADSEPGAGTTVTVYLPVLSGRGEHSTANRQRSVGGTVDTKDKTVRRVLLLDDDEDVLVAMKLMFERMGWSVTCTKDLESSLEVLYKATRPFDLITLDVIMSDGTECSEAFEKLQQAAPSAKIMLCTGFSGDEDLDALMERGACGVLTKPFSLATLKSEISKFFDSAGDD